MTSRDADDLSSCACPSDRDQRMKKNYEKIYLLFLAKHLVYIYILFLLLIYILYGRKNCNMKLNLGISEHKILETRILFGISGGNL